MVALPSLASTAAAGDSQLCCPPARRIRASGEVGRTGALTNRYLDELCATAQARLFVSYATGGADWYPDHCHYVQPAQSGPYGPAHRTLEPPEKLKDLLAQHDCRYHRAHALDVFETSAMDRWKSARQAESPVAAAAALPESIMGTRRS